MLRNGSFEQVEGKNVALPAGWQLGPESEKGRGCLLSEEAPAEGNRSLLLRRTASETMYCFAGQEVALERGRLYRLRFQARGDERALDMGAVCLAARGDEGPAWLYRPIELREPMRWEAQEIVVRAQWGFNPLAEATLEFRLNQWRPDFPWRRNRPQDREIPQRLWIDAVRFEPLLEGERAAGRVGRRLLVPGHDRLRYADIELGLGDGIGAEPDSVEVRCEGTAMTRVAFLDEIDGPGKFAYSTRSQRVYVAADADAERFEFFYLPRSESSGGAFLGTAPPGAGRALRDGSAALTRIPLQVSATPLERRNWPVTQGLAFPPGVVAGPERIRLLGPAGSEASLQVQPTSFWSDDSIRWALLDFNIDASGGEAPVYTVECGPQIERAAVADPVTVQEDAEGIAVDTGPLQFRISKRRFRLLEDVVVDGHRPLAGPMAADVAEDTGLRCATDAVSPYAIAVEEAGPLRAVIVARGWHGSPDGGRLLTYTTRIHAYRGQRFVRVFHSLGNRHDDNVTGRHPYARDWSTDESNLSIGELPQRNIADATLTVPLGPVERWELHAGTSEAPSTSGGVDDLPATHRQTHHAEGAITDASGRRDTTQAQGIVSVSGPWGMLTAAVYRYANLFPKEMRISQQTLELGLLPFSATKPHGLIKGTERTTELLLAFDPPGKQGGPHLAQCFIEPMVLSNPEWYCGSRGFMGDPLVPANPHTVGTYDRMIGSFVQNVLSPYGPGVDDCGLMNFGDFVYTGRNIWLNLEYDGDLGLYMHFSRTGDARAFWRAMDGSRHFLDVDTNWHTGEFDTHGGNSPHDVAHHRPTRPAGHIYTLGLAHYYLLTGDRRALEATRLNASACHRVLYHRIHQYTSAFTDEEDVAFPRGYMVPGGPAVSANSRNSSDPARYALHSYLVTGEPRFLDAAISIADALTLGWPDKWRTDDDTYMHYRWPQIIGRLHEMTGAERYRKLIMDCADWMLADPYAKYGEYRVGQCYGAGPQLPGRQNNTRLLFMTAHAWRITGDRRYLDWMLNMYDAQIERGRHRDAGSSSGKSLGKEADNPARGLAWIAPHRMVLTEPSPERFQVLSPAEEVWRITVGNTTEGALQGTVEVGPLPAGVQMSARQEFDLEVGEEKTLELSVRFTEELPAGRTLVPYRVTTTSAEGGRTGARNGFFAVHALLPLPEGPPRLLFHATLDDAGPATSHTGPVQPIIEDPEFVDGRFGRALGAGTSAWSFDLTGRILPEQGSLAIWIRCSGSQRAHGLLRVRGHGWPLVAIFTNQIGLCGTMVRRDLAAMADRWQHVVLTWDLRELRFYVDGELIQSAERENLEMPTGELWALPQDAADFDDLRVYSAPLRTDAIADLANGRD